jgi:hypothetical protein
MTPRLYHLVYQSFATTPFSEEQLQALLTHSRQWNTDHSLTGVLLYSEGGIMQVLEGPEDEVRYIFNRISGDRRHSGVTKLSDGPVIQRNFSQWSMAFKAVNPDDFAQLKGYINPTQQEALSAVATHHDPGLHSVLADFLAEDTIRF